ncbi:MAG: hypothetical protein K2N27_01845 [Ruminococcus sp.]|nr:hypothetical protein [Ruminococcus sp.]
MKKEYLEAGKIVTTHGIRGEDFYKITPDEFRRTIGNMDSSSAIKTLQIQK